LINSEEYDIIIIGARFAGLIAACELSRRGGKVFMIEARDQIGGRTFTAQVDNQQYEIGGTWIHWSQPHIWTEMTRYGFSVIESEGAVANQISSLLDNGSRLKTVSTTDLYPQLFELANKFSDINGVQGRTVFPSPHGPLIKVSNKNLK
jgi:monoamine oxidase